MSSRWMFTLLLSGALGCASGATTPLDASAVAPAPDASASDASRADPDATIDPSVDASVGPDAGLVFALHSPAVGSDGLYPREFTCDGAGTSPPLTWSGVPAGTAELALLMTTLARDGLKWNWVLYHIPARATGLHAATSGVGVAGLTSDGPNLAYSPPCSQGPGAKTYTFTLYALSMAPTFSEAPNRVTGAVVTSAIAPLTLGRAELVVSYTRP